ncbi:MAG: pilus assembly protein PilM, partial [Bdellovibrionaceae bacterium]|nr:pilus assembly protein PilM [Pseudobdellovibrionaceae bacterium]
DQELEVIEFLRQLTSYHAGQKVRYVMGLRQDRVVVRNRLFPFSDRLKIQKALLHELEDEIPFTSEQAIFDARLIRGTLNGMEVLACAASAEHVGSALKLMRDGGAELDILTMEGVGQGNLEESWWTPIARVAQSPTTEQNTEMPRRQVRLLAHLGHSRTLVAVLDQDRMIGVRSLPWGARQIAAVIEKKYSLPPADARREMEAKAFLLTTRQQVSAEARVFSDLIAHALKPLVHDLRMTLLELRTDHQADILGLHVSGGPSAIQGLCPWLTQQLEIPVNRRVALSGHDCLFARDKKIEPLLEIAAGLAIEGLRRPRNPALNFLKGPYARKSDTLKNIWTDYGHFIRAGTAVFGLLLLWGILREDFALRLNEASITSLKENAKIVARLGGRQANETNVKKFIREARNKAETLRQVESLTAMTPAIELLKRASETVPDRNRIGLEVRNFLVEGQQLTIEGYVNSPAEAQVLSGSLASLAVDGAVSALSPTLPQIQNRTAFAYRLNVDRRLPGKGRK